MQVTLTVKTDDELAFVDTFDTAVKPPRSITGIVVLLSEEQTTVELVKPGWRVVIEEIPK